MLAVTKMELGTHIYAWDTGDIGERTELNKEGMLPTHKRAP